MKNRLKIAIIIIQIILQNLTPIAFIQITASQRFIIIKKKLNIKPYIKPLADQILYKKSKNVNLTPERDMHTISKLKTL